ncbi:MAG: hypothetical protein M1833_005787 [Piccolia ochrophora]|nr:MAG: hypothetical protein M1833_005787 [Piccolia ochrophora]
MIQVGTLIIATLGILGLSHQALAAPSAEVAQGPTLVARAPIDIKRKYKRYVALGDSYSAGPGNEAGGEIKDAGIKHPPEVTNCYVTDGGWPNQLQTGKNWQFQFSACTGYNTTDIKKYQIDGAASKFENPDLVTLTLGGNNKEAFLNVVLKCPYGVLPKPCTEAINAARETIEGIGPEIQQTVLAARDKNRNGGPRTVVVMGYPTFYQEDGRIIDCISPARREEINALVTSLNEKLKGVTETINGEDSDEGVDVLFADPNNPKIGNPDEDASFDNHRFCERKERAFFAGWPDSSRYLFRAAFTIGVFHPTKDGHYVMAAAAQNQIATLDPLPE